MFFLSRFLCPLFQITVCIPSNLYWLVVYWQSSHNWFPSIFPSLLHLFEIHYCFVEPINYFYLTIIFTNASRVVTDKNTSKSISCSGTTRVISVSKSDNFFWFYVGFLLQLNSISFFLSFFFFCKLVFPFFCYFLFRLDIILLDI